MSKDIEIIEISPVNMPENIVADLSPMIVKNLSKIINELEIILIDNGSPYNSWSKIFEIAKNEKRIKGL